MMTIWPFSRPLVMTALRRLALPSRWRQLWKPLAAGLALLFLMADDGIGKDEFQCEVAVVHLADCCPDFPAKALFCVSDGCDRASTPDLSEERATCLRGKTCDELLALGACDISRWERVPSCVKHCSQYIPPCQ